MASPHGPQAAFNIASNENGSSITVQISEKPGIKADNLSLSTWGASFVLSNLLHKLPLPRNLHVASLGHTKPLRILELGAGTGLVGLSAAALWPSEVLLTDLAPILPALDANIALNKDLLMRTGSSISSASLDWNTPTQIAIPSRSSTEPPQTIDSDTWKAKIILAADTLYAEEHPELIVNAITTWLAPGDRARAVLCYPLRIAYIDHIRKFWGLAESAGLECVDEGRQDGGEDDWNEVANTPYEWCIWRWRGAGEDS